MFGDLRKEVGEAISKVCKMEGVVILKAATLPDHFHDIGSFREPRQIFCCAILQGFISWSQTEMCPQNFFSYVDADLKMWEN